MARSQLDRLRRHAELYGTEEVFEVAVADGFTAADLGRFALELRRIEPKWRLTRWGRIELLVRLEQEGLPDRRIRHYLGVSQDTLKRMREKDLRDRELCRVFGISARTLRKWRDPVFRARRRKFERMARTSRGRARKARRRAEFGPQNRDPGSGVQIEGSAA